MSRISHTPSCQSYSDKPLAIDLYCGLGGWTQGLLAEGYTVVGFDLERHVYGDHRYPAQLVLQDVLTLTGRQFKDAALIVASPPCQAFSYMAMPWSRAKQIAKEYRDGTRDTKQLTALFDACFRIQREAIAAAGHFIPLVVENVRGAQPWVGQSRWNYGSFHLWGDVPALMPMTVSRIVKRPGRSMNQGAPQWGPHHDTSDIVDGVKVTTMGAGWYPPDHPKHVPGLAFNGHAERALKYGDCNGKRFDERPKGNVAAHREGTKTTGHVNQCDGHSHMRRLTNQRESDALKGCDGGWFNDLKRQGKGETGRLSRSGSKSNARKAASAMIAKIPLTLARHIAASWKPIGVTA